MELVQSRLGADVLTINSKQLVDKIKCFLGLDFTFLVLGDGLDRFIEFPTNVGPVPDQLDARYLTCKGFVETKEAGNERAGSCESS
jgi:hypothetical protein